MYRYEEYKDSGVELIGQIPNHWEYKKNKYILKYKKGKNPKSISENPNKNIYLSMDYLRNRNHSIQYISDVSELYKVQENEILLLWDGANAGEFFVSKTGYLSSTMAHIIFEPGINKTFGRFYSYIIEAELRKTTIGMGIPHVNSLKFENFIFLLPPLNEQHAIAKFLNDKSEKINTAITIKEQQIEKLKELRQVTIHDAITKGIQPHVDMKDSKIDWIDKVPKHWEILANRILFKERNEKGKEGLPLLSVSIHTAVSSEEIEEHLNVRGRIKIEDKSSYKLVKTNDIVFNMMRAWQGAIGRVSNVGMVSPAYIVAKPIKEINSMFLEYQYRTNIYIETMNKVSKGITDFRKRLYWDQFKGLVTIVPPIQEQKHIVNYLDQYTNKIDQAIAQKVEQITKLKEYKQCLINEVVTGKIKVI